MKYYLPILFLFLFSCNQSENKKDSSKSPIVNNNKVNNDSVINAQKFKIDTYNKDTLIKHKPSHIDRKTIYEIKRKKITNNKKLQEVDKLLIEK